MLRVELLKYNGGFSWEEIDITNHLVEYPKLVFRLEEDVLALYADTLNLQVGVLENNLYGIFFNNQYVESLWFKLIYNDFIEYLGKINLNQTVYNERDKTISINVVGYNKVRIDELKKEGIVATDVNFKTLLQRFFYPVECDDRINVVYRRLWINRMSKAYEEYKQGRETLWENVYNLFIQTLKFYGLVAHWGHASFYTMLAGDIVKVSKIIVRERNVSFNLFNIDATIEGYADLEIFYLGKTYQYLLLLYKEDLTPNLTWYTSILYDVANNLKVRGWASDFDTFFEAYKDITLDLRPQMVLVGADGSLGFGKTHFLSETAFEYAPSYSEIVNRYWDLFSFRRAYKIVYPKILTKNDGHLVKPLDRVFFQPLSVLGYVYEIQYDFENNLTHLIVIETQKIKEYVEL